MFRYEPQAEGSDESRRKQEVKKINSELLKKLQDLDTDIVFSTGEFFLTWNKRTNAPAESISFRLYPMNLLEPSGLNTIITIIMNTSVLMMSQVKSL